MEEELEKEPLQQSNSLSKLLIGNTSTQVNSFIWIQDVDNSTHGWNAPQSLLHNQGYGRGDFQTLRCWIPKSAY